MVLLSEPHPQVRQELKTEIEYQGFEQGPIRPPSEAASLLVRITHNCPWNRCTFCPVYKGADFSLRPVEHVIEDIDRVARYVTAIRECSKRSGKIFPADIERMTAADLEPDRVALGAALNWASSGMRSIFLQDANSLVIKPERLLRILHHLRQCFPWVKRITSYARSHTIARISDENLGLMADGGLTRIHIGMESGSNAVLDMVKKGVDKNTHIRAGKKVKKAGMELSEYIMPGLGGSELSRDHAIESADALNQINPDFIRLRSLAIPPHVELAGDLQEGNFTKMGDVETAEEILVFLKALNNITSIVKSDHVLNLFEELEGKFPEDKVKMVSMVESFLSMPQQEQMYYQVGRRMGLFRGIQDMADMEKMSQVQQVCSRSGVTPATVDSVIDELMKRFI